MAENDTDRLEARLEATSHEFRRWFMQLDTRVETLRTAHSLLWDEVKRLNDSIEDIKKRCGI